LEKFKGQPWTFDALNEWLYKPSSYAPGTRMSFAGITNDKQRADVIAYLRTLSDNPVPLPAPEAAKPAAAQQPAAGAAAAQQPAAGQQPSSAQPSAPASPPAAQSQPPKP
jgi:cytochrome c